MRITGKIAHDLLGVLDELHEQLKRQQKPPYPYAEWERKREQVKDRLQKLPAYVEEAASLVQVRKGPGKPKAGDLVQRTMLFLFARMMNKSNRDVEWSEPFRHQERV